MSFILFFFIIESYWNPYQTDFSFLLFLQIPVNLSISAEQFQRATTISAPRIEMNQNPIGNAFNISIHQLKREVDSYKQRQQEIVSFDQVGFIYFFHHFL